MPPSCKIAVKAVPGASRDALDGRMGPEFKVRVRAPALDGRANEAVCSFLAAELGIPRRAVTLVRGEKSRHKVLLVSGLGSEEAERRLSRPGPAA